MPAVTLLALTHSTSVRLAEVGFVLIIFTGLWLLAAEIPRLRLQTLRMIVAGAALTAAGILLFIAVHSGKFVHS